MDGFSVKRHQRHAETAAADAMETNDVAALVKLDDRFHAPIYEASANSLISETAEPHWRFLRRAMADVLRQTKTPADVWRQHLAVLNAMLTGAAEDAGRLAEDHARDASLQLFDVLTSVQEETRP